METVSVDLSAEGRLNLGDFYPRCSASSVLNSVLLFPAIKITVLHYATTSKWHGSPGAGRKATETRAGPGVSQLLVEFANFWPRLPAIPAKTAATARSYCKVWLE